MFLVEFIFFFFKQKTAYEIRKGDWSSDVCSSDLRRRAAPPAAAARGARAPRGSRWPSAVRGRPPSSAEEPTWADGEHDDEDDEPDDLAVGSAERRRARRLRQAQHEAADESAEHRAEPGEDDDDQRLERPLEPDRRADGVRDGDEGAGGARERGAEREGEEIGAADVDACEQRGLPVLRRRADRLAPAPA